MIQRKKIAFILFLVAFSAGAQNKPTLLDEDWRFHRGGAQGAEQIQFDDSGWRRVDLPHDWSIEDLPGTQSPFHRDAISGVSGGFTTGGTAWYRKTFSLPSGEKTKKVFIQFDGIYMNPEVWLNGELLGHHPYGYTGFFFDITTKVKTGEVNTLAVKVKNEGENSRWYSGSGIYRHVWLIMVDPIHVERWGTSVTTPEVATSSARVSVKTIVKNETSQSARITLVTRLMNAKSVEVAKAESSQNIQPGADYEFTQDVSVNSPEQWSLESPVLYMAVSEVYHDQQLTDRTETPFGIRTISINAKNGFLLNGKSVKLKGGCVHHDNGPLGSKAYDRAEERRVELLKASGYNAIRCSHNPPSPAFLDACDRLGMLVIDEAFDMWSDPKNPYDYHLYFDEWWQKDIDAMILRDRNHPSVILWSIGNEIPGMETPEVIQLAKKMTEYIHKNEPTRMVTAAVNGLSERKDPFFSSFDIAGYNYAFGGDHNQKSLYALDHDRLPDRVMFGSESYPLEAFGSWMNVMDHSWVIGDFVWTAFDYIGEASIGWRGYWQEQNFYPWTLAFCGDIDICGWKRPQSYYRDALWKENELSVFVKPPHPSFEPNPRRESWSKWHWHDAVASWNWKGHENEPIEVNVYSSCESVELFLNGKSLGRKVTNRSSQFMAAWTVSYQPGELKAIGYSGKKKINTAVLLSASEPTQLKLTADRQVINADGQDLSYITIELTDAEGVRNPDAEDLLKFEIAGPGTIVGAGNANPVSVESYQSKQRKAWQGRCLVIIKSGRKGGEIKLTATASGLQPGTISIQAKE